MRWYTEDELIALYEQGRKNEKQMRELEEEIDESHRLIDQKVEAKTKLTTLELERQQKATVMANELLKTDPRSRSVRQCTGTR